MKIKKIYKRIKKNVTIIMQKLNKYILLNAKILIYLSMFIIGIAVIVFSFFAKNNWVNISSGVGAGLFTSLSVSVIINSENNAREKRKKEENKRFVLTDIVAISINIYEDIIYRINKYIMFTNIVDKPIYKLYDDFSIFNEFAEQMEKIDFNSSTDETKEKLNVLFDFSNCMFNYFALELKRFPKQEYYLRGLLTQEEYISITSNYANDTYARCLEKLQEFWDGGIKDLSMCIKFLRMTIRICSNIISALPYCKNVVSVKENIITEIIDRMYYEEIYCNSDAYIQEQCERAKDEYEYYANHTEEAEKLVIQMERERNEILDDYY